MNKKAGWLLYWAPRIISILYLFLLSLFSLDVISSGLSFWQTVTGLVMHNLLVFVLLIVLIISWKRELVGGIIFNLIGLSYIAMMLARAFKISSGWPEASSIIVISIPALIIGILFTANWQKRKKSRA